MTDFEKSIYQVIASGKGLKGAEIAEKLGVEKSRVNSTLSKSVALKAHVVQGGDYRWRLKSSLVQEAETKSVNIPAPDEDLRNICNYYLNCLAVESRSAVSQFLTSWHELNYVPVAGLDVDSIANPSTVRLLNRVNSDKTKTAYLGYPVRIFTIRSNKGAFRKIAPVFLFEVFYDHGQIEINWTPTINLEVLKAYSVEGGADAIVTELAQLEEELGINVQDADIDIDEMVLRLAEVRQWDYQEEINPYRIPFSESLNDLPDGINNRAIIIEAERDAFTQGLESELMILANMPTENYKGTALYSWIKGEQALSTEESVKPLLEVLPLNSEQSDAVNTALRSDLTIVTGPPGTGKSQVVTDLLINIAWNGKSALFSSKNNKAVDVVDIRVNGLCKRPVVLRIGSNNYAGRLAEIIEGLLNARPNISDQSETDFYLSEYTIKSAEAESIGKQKEKTIQERNQLDAIERQYCLVRERMTHCFEEVCEADIGKAQAAATTYYKAFNAACKEKQNLFVRLFWNAFAAQRENEKRLAAEAFNLVSQRYGLSSISDNAMDSDFQKAVTEALEFEKALLVTLQYKSALEAFKNQTPLEELDKRLSENKDSMAQVAANLWNKWLLSQTIAFSASERNEMSNFVSAMKLAGDVNLSEYPELKKQFSRMSKEMTKYLQCWAVTSLSAKSRVPFQAGMFDYVIIDEASQCDIASIIPLLYRAKRAVIIGDPKQLSHISQLSKKQDLALLQKYHVSPAWSYSTNSLYSLAEGKVGVEQIIQLKDHFRCCADIIEFSNDTFYDGNLRTATKYSALKTPAGDKPGIRWLDVQGKTVRPPSGSAYNAEEAQRIVEELKRLVSVGYKGTIGVTTPFRRQADEVRRILETKEKSLLSALVTRHEFIADTVHKFQGDERDLMIFSPVVSDNTPATTLGFLESTGNLFNVAITRARAVLVVVGNHRFCAGSGVSYLSKFAEYYSKLSNGGQKFIRKVKPAESREYPVVDNPEQVSEWEKRLYTALFDAGVKTIPQYPEDKYKLDFALIRGVHKLDIEVDGVMYHRQWNGELSYRDQLRNQRMYELGWDVKRFWVYQIRDDLGWCVKEVLNWLNEHN